MTVVNFFEDIQNLLSASAKIAIVRFKDALDTFKRLEQCSEIGREFRMWGQVASTMPECRHCGIYPSMVRCDLIHGLEGGKPVIHSVRATLKCVCSSVDIKRDNVSDAIRDASIAWMSMNVTTASAHPAEPEQPQAPESSPEPPA